MDRVKDPERGIFGKIHYTNGESDGYDEWSTDRGVDCRDRLSFVGQSVLAMLVD